MTDFLLHNGTYLDRGQEYEMDLLQGCVRIKIFKLDSRKEKIFFYVYEPTTIVTRDMSWQEFNLAYQRNMIRPYEPLRIVKRLPPHTFI